MLNHWLGKSLPNGPLLTEKTLCSIRFYFVRCLISKLLLHPASGWRLEFYIRDSL